MTIFFAEPAQPPHHWEDFHYHKFWWVMLFCLTYIEHMSYIDLFKTVGTSDDDAMISYICSQTGDSQQQMEDEKLQKGETVLQPILLLRDFRCHQCLEVSAAKTRLNSPGIAFQDPRVACGAAHLVWCFDWWVFDAQFSIPVSCGFCFKHFLATYPECHKKYEQPANPDFFIHFLAKWPSSFVGK